MAVSKARLAVAAPSRNAAPQRLHQRRDGLMIERAGERAFDHALHGGHGSIRMQWHFLDTSRLPVAVQTWELPPGASEGMHVHDPDEQPLDELYSVLAGTGRMHVDDQTYDIATGDGVLAAAGTRHDLANMGPGPGRAPSGFW